MPITLNLNFPFFLSDATSPSLNPYKVPSFPLYNSVSLIKPNWYFTQRSSLLTRTRVENSILCSRNKKRRIGYRIMNRIVLENVYFFVSKLDILPEPLELVIREFWGGNGGGGTRFFKGFGGGGFGWWKKKTNDKVLIFLWVLMVFGLVMWLESGYKIDGHLIFAISALILLGFFVINCLGRGFGDCAIGVCFIAALGVLGLKKEYLTKKVKGFRSMICSRRRTRRRSM